MSNPTDEIKTPPSTDNNAPIVPKQNLIPFILLVSCFVLWGLLNNMTDNLVPAFEKIFSMDSSLATWVQVAFYGAYAVLAIPAAIIIKKFSYKTGVLVGLGLYMFGALGYVPASLTQNYYMFLVSIFVLASGLSILETSCNPYVISMGPSSTAVRRLNLAQMFNPMGSLTGLFLGKYVILSQLNPSTAVERAKMPEDVKAAIISDELFWLSLPYVALVLIAAAIFMTIKFHKMPEGADTEHNPHLKQSFKRLLSIPRYYYGVITQFFYVGVQITVWTFTIKYVRAVFPALKEHEAALYGIYALVLFICARVVCTALMKKLNPGSMMATLALAGILVSLGTIFLPGMGGVWCLVAISGCMSLMFPTIYGIALRDLGPEVKLGASGLIMAILGGAVITQIHGFVIDKLQITKLANKGYEYVKGGELKLQEFIDSVPKEVSEPCVESALRTSFFIAVACFIVVLVYAIAFRNSHLEEEVSPVK